MAWTGLAASLLLAGCMSTMSTSNGDRPLNREMVSARVADWAPASREAVMFMTDKYGPPAELTPTMAVWGQTGPWKRTIISARETPHNFPGPHPDVMEQVIDYRVPPEMMDEITAYDGSVIFERTKGELSARCDKEGANFLALNLADEIVRGARTVEEARAEYARQIMAMKAGQPAPLTERLMFTPRTGTADPDQPPAMSGAGR